MQTLAKNLTYGDVTDHGTVQDIIDWREDPDLEPGCYEIVTEHESFVLPGNAPVELTETDSLVVEG